MAEALPAFQRRAQAPCPLHRSSNRAGRHPRHQATSVPTRPTHPGSRSAERIRPRSQGRVMSVLMPHAPEGWQIRSLQRRRRDRLTLRLDVCRGLLTGTKNDGEWKGVICRLPPKADAWELCWSVEMLWAGTSVSVEWGAFAIPALSGSSLTGCAEQASRHPRSRRASGRCRTPRRCVWRAASGRARRPRWAGRAARTTPIQSSRRIGAKRAEQQAAASAAWSRAAPRRPRRRAT